MKVLGVGFGRTGTLSLKAALEQAGFGPCYHMFEITREPKRAQDWINAADGKPADWDAVFAGYQSAVDWPACGFWREHVAAYPDAKVILTIRDPQSWYDSMLQIVPSGATVMRQEAGSVMDMMRIGRMVEKVVWNKGFDGRFSDREYALDVYARHNAAVRAEVPADRLLVYEVRQGWGPLREFLDVDIPDGTPFPHLNDGASFGETLRRTMIPETV